MNRTVIVGDVHGCIDELQAILRAVSFDAKADRLVLAGDLVAKGPASGEVVQAAREWKALGVRGGGSVPADLDWSSNPKQYQEENGSAALRIPAETVRNSQSE